MKRLFAFLIALSCCAASNVALADEITEDATPVNDAVVIEETVDVKDPNAVTVMVNGTELIADVPAQIMNDRTMLPMRAIFEKLGANVSWMEKDQAIFATKNTLLVVMRVGSTDLLVSDFNSSDKNIVLDVVPQIVDGRTLVPVRAVSEALGCTVEWDGETRTVTITE